MAGKIHDEMLDTLVPRAPYDEIDSVLHRWYDGITDRITFPVPHDAARPLGFVIHGEGLRVGIATDLGHATTLVRERLRGCNVLMIEANHDDRMLQEGPYPWHLKQRVSGRLGHLSNHEAADVLAEAVDESCRCVVLAHLSEKNNTQELARRSAVAALKEWNRSAVEVRVAEATAPTAAVCL